ncbi:MAG: TetR family transcriptional regulator [Pseudomonadales bacterium]|jgi:TetR/AcrR family transcriptional repressor of mexAB-oprM operon|nr:TetR family transcriptional regulator [Pseudomonadales bacterium]HMU89950.1 TetR family transcriptional regulator [Pseudomonadales bacterium]HMW15620.1 TetR family transcriptional regulator [Pseudomonadales bacterium]HMW83121.1 TetR family transcriptional regulator [Pseudomonadales bacterium]HMY96912.1 TetR family transcriptional regulator [Pseudomonadales bacterium]
MARRTKMEAEQTREQIIDAAEELFLTRGVARATLEQIAQAAGVTRGAIYWHFRNKTDLFDAMYCRVHDPVEDLVSQSLALEDEGAIEALRNFCVQSLLSLARDRRRRRVYSILFHHCEFVDGLQESNQRLIAIQHRGLASMEALFRRAREQGSLPNVCPRLAAIAIHTSMLGLYFDYLREPDAYDLEREAAPLVDLIFRCIT